MFKSKGTIDQLQKKANRLIERRDGLVYDVASYYGQIVENVCHMDWFVRAVMIKIALDEPKYEHLLGRF